MANQSLSDEFIVEFKADIIKREATDNFKNQIMNWVEELAKELGAISSQEHYDILKNNK